MRILVSLSVFAAVAAAQTSSSITGYIRGANAQPVSAARVTAVNIETGLSRETQSDAGGRYVIPNLRAGAYEVKVEASGFRPLKRTGIRLTVAETAALNLTIELGTVEQAITVQGEAPLVNTTTSEMSYMVNEGAIATLPLNGRNYTDLALLQPGVVAYPHRDGGSVVAHGLGITMNGQDPRANVYLLDGTPLNDFTNGPAGSAASTVLGMETIREFRVETNVYSAEFGRLFGGQVNALTKSGTNALHGSVYYYHRNDNLDARNFFDPSDNPEFKRNQFGGSLGGAIKRDKIFLFGGYEALRERLGRTVTSVVPDANAHNGLIPNPAIPGGLLNVGVNAEVRPYLDEFPLPNAGNLGTGLGRYSFIFPQKVRQDFGQLRYDHHLGDAGQFFVRYTADDADQLLPVELPQFPRQFLSRNQFITAQHDRAFTARVLNTARLGFSRTRVGQDVAVLTSKPLQPFVPGRLPGNIDIGGASRFGPQASVNVKLTQNVYTFEDHVAIIRGHHTLKVGGLVEHYQDNMVNPTFSLGTYAFADIRAFLENRPLRYIGLGPTGQYDRYWRFTLFGGFIQDSWAVAPGLTLNIGARYETTTMPEDIYGRDSSLPNIYTDTAPTPGQLYEGPARKNFSPRFGFAWDPRRNGRTSIRGGYGWFFNTNNHQNLIVTVTNPPATPRFVITQQLTFPNPPFERGVGNTMRPIEWNVKNPNLHMWNLNVQQQLPLDMVVTLGYAGSRGIHLLRSSDINIPAPTPLADGTLFWAAGLPRPNRAFGTIEIKKSDGNSWYQAGIFEIRKRWSSGFNLQSSYTFARTLDTTQASTFFSDATNDTTSAMPEYAGFSYNKGLSDFHAKHNWLLNFSWEIPFAKNMTGAGKAILDGWQFAGIHNLRSGSPLTLFVQANRSRSQWAPSLGPGLGPDRPSMAPGFTHESAILGRPEQWFDPNAFVLQPIGTLGNMGRGALIGPNLRTFDLSLLKNIRWARLGEGGAIQFRVEAFNIFNRSNFGVPRLLAFAGTADGERPQGSLGLIQNTITSSRQIQMSLRVQF